MECWLVGRVEFSFHRAARDALLRRWLLIKALKKVRTKSGAASQENRVPVQVHPPSVWLVESPCPFVTVSFFAKWAFRTGFISSVVHSANTGLAEKSKWTFQPTQYLFPDYSEPGTSLNINTAEVNMTNEVSVFIETSYSCGEDSKWMNKYYHFLSFLFGMQLINNVVIVSGTQRSNSTVYIHVSILPQTSPPIQVATQYLW